MLINGRPKLADSRSSASSYERQLWRKQTLNLDISAAIYDPQLTLKMNNNN